MIYIFTSADGSPIGAVADDFVAERNRCEPGYETEAALQFFFPNVNTSMMQELADGWWLVDDQRVYMEVVV
jgi:hypothetical protein